MKRTIMALMIGTLLLPATSFAHDWFPWYGRRTRVDSEYAREHPRWPRAYCHRHRYRLHADDKRRHCHDWDRGGRYGDHDLPVYRPWRGFGY